MCVGRHIRADWFPIDAQHLVKTTMRPDVSALVEDQALHAAAQASVDVEER
jgi:hypothetical protein